MRVLASYIRSAWNAYDLSRVPDAYKFTKLLLLAAPINFPKSPFTFLHLKRVLPLFEE